MTARSVVYGALFCALLLSLGFNNRPLLQVLYWHLTHRSTLAIGDYRVKVPLTWHVVSIDDRFAVISDIRPKKVPGRIDSPRVLFMSMGPLKSKPEDVITYGQPREVIPIDRFAGEHASCFTYKASSLRVAAESNVIDWVCISEGGLSVHLTGLVEDQQSLRQILDSIQKSR
jgi:hypothetical protein